MTSYIVQARLAEDRELIARITACAAGEDVARPAEWVQDHVWQFAVQPGWCCTVTDAGGASSAITDEMIHTAVLTLLARENPEPTPEPEPEEPASEPEEPPSGTPPEDPLPDPEPDPSPAE
ncbi:hypothetical protein JD276_14015 [Leucobacter sp. CSA1]|uniref:Uncharacterized protein n=1 Tax=Leucobacter chromiisoli TaxID=2796471 RepID=A0A934Q8F4_9MICO|nr:hypothetical protein [Leucobacter chromiisoli]MBK0420149.1 hypothetical protein [Leucobacter chromiisoli]